MEIEGSRFVQISLEQSQYSQDASSFHENMLEHAFMRFCLYIELSKKQNRNWKFWKENTRSFNITGIK